MWPGNSKTPVTECVVCAWNSTRSYGLGNGHFADLPKLTIGMAEICEDYYNTCSIFSGASTFQTHQTEHQYTEGSKGFRKLIQSVQLRVEICVSTMVERC